jgi:hypothetical protein
MAQWCEGRPKWLKNVILFVIIMDAIVCVVGTIICATAKQRDDLIFGVAVAHTIFAGLGVFWNWLPHYCVSVERERTLMWENGMTSYGFLIATIIAWFVFALQASGKAPSLGPAIFCVLITIQFVFKAPWFMSVHERIKNNEENPRLGLGCCALLGLDCMV